MQNPVLLWLCVIRQKQRRLIGLMVPKLDQSISSSHRSMANVVLILIDDVQVLAEVDLNARIVVIRAIGSRSVINYMDIHQAIQRQRILQAQISSANQRLFMFQKAILRRKENQLLGYQSLNCSSSYRFLA
uniref:Uncharacterized protein n=1 Tax=Nelumbo nucifera TaxID=4432 RepID=A0A822Y1F6_NELNU|nr:TPA_asm: hypothetical protein HUJ06_026550 [Nelumbo nucifera]